MPDQHLQRPIQILMLGDCTLATSYMPPRLKSETRLAEALRVRYPHDTFNIINEGLDGESIASFLRRYERTLARHTAPDYILIRYGVNDRKRYGVYGFRLHLEELCQKLTSDYPQIRILLETGVYVDYPTHYAFDRNRRLQPIYDVIRDLSKRKGFALVDIYERMQRETENGNWDLRARGYGSVDEDHPVLGAAQDHLFGHDIRWFTNIHPNHNGVAIIADEEAHIFALHWPTSLHPALNHHAGRTTTHFNDRQPQL